MSAEACVDRVEAQLQGSGAVSTLCAAQPDWKLGFTFSVLLLATSQGSLLWA